MIVYHSNVMYSWFSSCIFILAANIETTDSQVSQDN